MVGAEVLRLLRDLDAYLRMAKSPNAAESNIEKTLKVMQGSLDRIERQGNLNAGKKTSYAAAAAAGRERPLAENKKTQEGEMTSPKAPTFNRKARDITLIIADKKEREGMKKISNKELIENLQAKRVQGVRGVARMGNGNIRIQMESEQEKHTLQAKEGWAHRVCTSATVHQKTYSVRVYGMKVSHIDTTKQAESIAYLTAANARVHPGLVIKKVAWSTRAIKEQKEYSTLHVDVTTPEAANKLISEGLVEDFEIKDCKRFTRGCTLTQCFRCQRYGHIGKTCRNHVACGHCADEHKSEDCAADHSKPYQRCVVCKENGHEAWAAVCRVRKEEKLKAEKVMQNRAPFYTIQTVQPSLTLAPHFWPTIMAAAQAIPQAESLAESCITDSSVGGVATRTEVAPHFEEGFPFKTVYGKKGKAARRRSVSETPAETQEMVIYQEPAAETPKRTWEGSEIMNPNNMRRALSKRPVGRPRGATTVTPTHTQNPEDPKDGEL